MEVVEGQTEKRSAGRPRLPEEDRRKKTVNCLLRETDYAEVRRLFPDRSISAVLYRGLQLAMQEAQAS